MVHVPGLGRLPPPEPAPPRVLRVRLEGRDRCSAELAPFSDPDPRIEAVGCSGGPGLSAALLHGWARRGAPGPAPLALAVGDAVRRGLPTAARLTVAARAPLHGRLSEGQVGSDLGPRLAALAAGLWIEAHDPPPAAERVLCLEQDGSARLVQVAGLERCSPAAAAERLQAEFGPHASLRLGAAGRAGVRFASLAAGGERPSFVGRGGLGAVLGGLGLGAVVVRAEIPPPSPDGAALELLRALGRSPRLALRAEAGTLELWHALAVRGELRDGGDHPLSPELALQWVAQARAAAGERQGCRGCPTPCGWTFQRTGGEGGQRAHFGAAQALGPALGLVDFDQVLALLETCDELGVDAKEAGALLDLWCTVGERDGGPGARARGDVGALRGALRNCLTPQGADLAAGAAAFAARHGLAPRPASRPGSSPLERLAEQVNVAGGDPMRSFPFLVGEVDEGRLERLTGLVAPAPGELVWWHENFVAAVDATGFCAFSAAGLLADGLADLDRLAHWIAPGSGGGDELLARGASIVLLRRQVQQQLEELEELGTGAALEAQDGELAAELASYRAARGLDARGRPRPEVWAALGTVALARPQSRPTPWPRSAPPAREHAMVATPVATPVAAPSARAARVQVRTVHGSGEHLVSPPSVAGLLAQLDRPTHAVWRDGRRLAADEPLHDGDALDLVAVIAGG
jgi:aldehyde:ferredoxin oxidoreductase